MEQNAYAGTPMAPIMENKQKSGNGLRVATAIACAMAVCGMGFGIYGMVLSSSKDNSGDNRDSSTVADFVGDYKNLVLISSEVEDAHRNESSMVYELEGSVSTFGGGEIRVVSGDGDLKCSINSSGFSWEEDNCDLSAHSGRVSDVRSCFVGNGGNQYILVLTEDGKVEYIENYSESGVYVLKKLMLPKEVVSIYSDVGASQFSSREDGGFIGSGATALVVYSDGQIADIGGLLLGQ